MSERILKEEQLPEGWEVFPSSLNSGGRIILRMEEDTCIGYVQQDFRSRFSQGFIFPKGPLPGTAVKAGYGGGLEQAILEVENEVQRVFIPRAEFLRQARAYEAAEDSAD